MMATLSVVFAVLAAVSNALGTVLQRRAALIVPQSDGFRLRLMWDLLRTPVWFGGILGVIFAAVFQGLALVSGPLAVVQPIFVLELPFALLISGLVFRKRMSAGGWFSVAAIVVGLGTALSSAAPSGGSLQPPGALWLLALVSCGGAMVLLAGAALKRPVGPARAACLGTAAAIGYALTAALMKSATDTLDHRGVGAFFTSWQTYAFAAVGVCALFLLENAMQAGPLVASQPALTLGDALISLSLGVTLYSESVRTGWWLIPEMLGVGLVLVGAVGLSRLDANARPATDANATSDANAGTDPRPGTDARLVAEPQGQAEREDSAPRAETVHHGPTAVRQDVSGPA
ncbi:DMT family transporter [Streptacidiphilus sp. EB129]|uniref:DMT family transporter n=1 Tax=Streptacidiphilus sp. EB129 TaxID=3156262 RepID=UPI003519BB0F